MESSDLIKIEKLKKNDEWPQWKFQLRIILQSNDLMDFITGKEKKPDRAQFANDTAFETALITFNKSEYKAQRIIVTALGKEAMLHVMNCASSCEMWIKLESVYEKKSKVTIHLMQERFYNFKMEPGDSMAIHVSKLQSVVQQLKDLGEKVSESMIITKLLLSLPSELSHFHSAWESTAEKEQTMENLTARLIMEEARIAKHHQDEISEALVAKKSFKRPLKEDKAFNKSNEKPGKCFLCKENGHWKRDCPSRKTKEGNSFVNSSKNFSGESSSKPSGKFRRGEAFVSLVEAMSVTEDVQKSEVWYLDSGASDHMTYDKGLFVEYEDFKEEMRVRIGNGSYIVAKGQGIVNILAFNNSEWCEKHLSNVLYVPDLHLNLFSQNTALDKGYKLKANSLKCEFLDADKVVAVAIRKSNLFELMFKVVGDVSGFAVTKENTPEGNSESRRWKKTCITTRGNTSCSVLSLFVWHKRLGHQNIAQVKKVLRNLNINFKEDKDFFCEDCMMGKHHRSSFNSSESRATKTGELVHADVCGPMQTTSLGGSRYFVLFKDDFSNYRTVYFMKQKSEVSRYIEKYLNLVKSINSTVSVFRSDNGLEFVNVAVIKLFEMNGVRHQRTVTYTPEQNGRAEREMRTIVEAARTMLHSRNLDIVFWAEAVNTAVYILNLTGTSPVKDKSPFQLWFNRSPSVNHLRVFGSQVYIHVPKQKRKKWDKKAKKGIFVGYCTDTKGYRVWVPEDKVIEITRDIVFREEDQNSQGELPSSDSEEDFVFFESNGSQDNSVGISFNEEDSFIDENQFNSDGSNVNIENEKAQSGEDDEIVFENIGSKQNLRVRMPKPIIPTKEKPVKSGKSNDASLEAMVIGYAFVAVNEPDNYDEALKSDDSIKWKDAMDDEFLSLQKNQTWKLVNLPEGRKLVNSRWVFKVKEKPNGEIERFKARLVVCGYTQEYGIDYEETFSPVVKFTSIRAILAMAAAEGLKTKQFDVKTAFLYGELSEEIYMRQPKGYEDGTSKVCKLQRSLYGLKQSSRCWNEKFTKFLENYDLKATSADVCVFVSKKGERKIVLAIFIDDGIVAATHNEDISKLIQHLIKEFEIKVSDAKFFIGVEIDQQNDGSIHICQRAYTKKILERFRMMDAHSVATPAECQVNRELTDSHPSYPYREAVGSLMYLAIGTRPDIAFAVGKVSRHLNNPTESDVNCVKRIFKYLRGTMDLGIIYESNAKLTLNCFSDSDYAGDSDTRRSTTGYVVILGSGAISWSSQLQKCVALSSTEAEYVSSSQAIKELVWLNSLVEELFIGYDSQTLFMDNQSAIRLIKNPEFHKRTKHIDVMYHFIREKFRDGFFVLNYIPTNDQVADILTKPLSRDKFVKFRQLMGMC